MTVYLVVSLPNILYTPYICIYIHTWFWPTQIILHDMQKGKNISPFYISKHTAQKILTHIPPHTHTHIHTQTHTYTHTYTNTHTHTQTHTHKRAHIQTHTPHSPAGKYSICPIHIYTHIHAPLTCW